MRLTKFVRHRPEMTNVCQVLGPPPRRPDRSRRGGQDAADDGRAAVVRRSVTVLATSREPPGIPGEAVLAVPSWLCRTRLSRCSPTVRDSCADFVVTADNAAAVSQICHRRDGMRLAIESAAAGVSARYHCPRSWTACTTRLRSLTGSSRLRSGDSRHCPLAWIGRMPLSVSGIVSSSAGWRCSSGLRSGRPPCGRAADVAGRRRALDQLSLLGGRRQPTLCRPRHGDHYGAVGTVLDTPGRPAGNQPPSMRSKRPDTLRHV